MKKLSKVSVAAIAAAALVLGSCNKGAQNTTTETKTETATAPATGEMKIAYIVYDSIFTQYEFCKESRNILEKKQKNIQATVGKKEKALQDAASKFEQDIRANKYTQQQAEGVQANLQKQAYDLQMLKENLLSTYAKEEEKLNKELMDDIQKFIADFNKDGKYAYILSKMGDNILYGAPQFNITDEVIDGLNKAYKSKKK